MAIIEVKDHDPVGAIRELLYSVLSRELVSAILVPQETPSKKTVAQTLVRDPSKLATANPLAPVFGVNSAQIIARMCVGQMLGVETAGAEPAKKKQDEQAQNAENEEQTQRQHPQKEKPMNGPEQDKVEQPEPVVEAQSTAQQQPAVSEEESHPAPIAIVLRPCDIRALVELVKLQQARIDPFVVVGVDCWGTYSVQDYAAKADAGSPGYSVTADFLKQVTTGNLPEQLRSACQVCQYPAPTFADITIQLIGEDINRHFSFQAQTEKGKAFLNALGLENTPENNQRKDALAKLKEAKKQLAEQDPIDFLEMISSLCINCHNCRAVCPICYCKQCVFDGEVFAYSMDKFLNLSGKKGILSMPPDKLLFHLTRMSHVATSCVACGQCEAACPNGIPLGRVYQKISITAQEALGYEAGRSLDEELPLTTFREDELSAVED